MIQIIDNFLPDSYANHIAMKCYDLRWDYHAGTSVVTQENYKDFCLDNNTVDYGQFCFTFFSSVNDNPIEHREQFDFYMPVVYLAQEKIKDIKIVEILRAKINLITQRPDAPEYHYNIAHKDATVSNTYSMIYYINDSDGDTFLFNEFYNPAGPINNLTVAQRVTPKKNRAVIFESNRMHASSTPRNTKERFIMNLVLKAYNE